MHSDATPRHATPRFPQMFNKSIVQALAKHLEPLTQVLSNVIQGIPTKDAQEIKIRKILWNWLENLSTLFWCLACVVSLLRRTGLFHLLSFLPLTSCASNLPLIAHGLPPTLQ